MAIIPKQDHAEVPVLVGRRSTRVSVAVPILVRGMDASGNPFKEHTFTLNVNKHGAEIATSHFLAVDAEINIENISLKRSGLARVVQRRERRTPNSPYEVSIELLDPENIWGVRFPPADWDKESPPKTSKPNSEKAILLEAQQTPPAPLVNRPESPETPPAPPSAAVPEGGTAAEAAAESALHPAGSPAEEPREPERSGETPAEETAIGISTSQLEANAQPEAKPVTEEPPAASTHPDLPNPAGQPEMASLDERMETARSAERQLQELLSRLDSTSAQLESLLCKAGDVRGTLKSQMDGARADIKEAVLQSARSAKDEFTGSLRSDFETISSRMVEETRQRLQEEVSLAVSAFGKEAGAHLSKLTQESGPELEAKQKLAVSQAKEQIAGAADAATLELGGKLRNSAEEMSRSLEAQMKGWIEKSIADYANQLAQSVRAQAQSLLEGADSPLHKLRMQLEEESAGAGVKFREACAQDADSAATQISKQLETASRSLRSTAEEANAGLWEASKSIKHDLTFKAEKLRKHLADISSASEQGFRNYTEVQVSGAKEQISEYLRALATKRATEFSEQLQKTADGILESNAPQLQRQAEDALELCKGSLETSTREILKETRTQTAAHALESVAAFSNEATAATEQFNLQLQGTLQDFLTASALELQSKLRKAGEEEKQAIVSRIETESRMAGERVISEIKSRTEGAAKEATDAVYKQVGVATVVLKDWGDQAATRLEAQFRNSIDTFQRQVQELVSAALEANRQQAEASTQEIRSRLEQAARILSPESAEPTPKNPSSGEPGS
jgi:hypothetical protein